MTKTLRELQEELRVINGNDDYLFNTNEIIQCKTFAINKVLTPMMYKNELHYDISDNETFGIRVDKDKIKVSIMTYLVNSSNNPITVKTFMLIPKRYKKEMYRQQLITYLRECNHEFTNDTNWKKWDIEYV